MTLTRRDIAELLERHGLSPSRALGQNFVADPNTVRRIVRLAEVGPGDPVVEIGPGLGSLTTALAEAGARVTAVELDRHLVPVLEEVVDLLVRHIRARRSGEPLPCEHELKDFELVRRQSDAAPRLRPPLRKGAAS